MNLSKAERILREDDKAIRLRYSQEGPHILVERKTFRGKYGSHGPDGLVWRPDAGRRREEGHVPVASIPRDAFNLAELRGALRAADTWRQWDRQAKPNWQRIEEAEAQQKLDRTRSRKLDSRYRAAEVWNRYSWNSKSRVSVGENIH